MNEPFLCTRIGTAGQPYYLAILSMSDVPRLKNPLCSDPPLLTQTAVQQ